LKGVEKIKGVYPISRGKIPEEGVRERGLKNQFYKYRPPRVEKNK